MRPALPEALGLGLCLGQSCPAEEMSVSAHSPAPA